MGEGSKGLSSRSEGVALYLYFCTYSATWTRAALLRASLPSVACPWAMDKPAYVGFGMAFSHPPPRRTLPDSNKYVQKIAKALGNTIASRG